MTWQAEMLGIDLNDLKRERFSHPDHYGMMRAHDVRVRAWEGLQTRSTYQVAAAEKRAALRALAIADDMIDKQRRKQSRKKALETQKRRAGYSFTDKQMEIALRSLANGS
jgi:purine-nucleoside phosphorylase